MPQRFRQYVNESVAADDAALRDREAAYQARTEDNPSSYLGAAGGQVLPWITGAAALKAGGVLPTLPKMGDVAGVGSKAVNLLQKGGLLAGEGALMGATTPVAEEGDYGSQKAAQVATGAIAAPLLAGGLNAAGRVAGAAGRASRFLTSGGRERIANERVAQMLGVDNLPYLRGANDLELQQSSARAQTLADIRRREELSKAMGVAESP